MKKRKKQLMNNPDRETKGEEEEGGDWKVNRKKQNTFWTVSFLPVFTQFVYCGRRRLRRETATCSMKSCNSVWGKKGSIK